MSLSEYEENRQRNIERNNAQLRSLGLITALEELRSNCKASKTSSKTSKKIVEDGDEDYEDSDEDDEDDEVDIAVSST